MSTLTDAEIDAIDARITPGVYAHRDFARAILAAVREELGALKGERDQWRESVVDECIVAHTDFHEAEPRRTLKEIIAMHVLIATSNERTPEQIKAIAAPTPEEP